uniref:P/Homo B domain-containing protein n=1 Tax=Parascaris equorum TaxID=6256 RepID=A0A914RQB4_PAREQ
SWGPNDDGKTVEGPGRLAQAAILKGIRLGRNGKGAIYVWASGNGGLKDDDCDCDGYTDSVYTFSVSSAAEDGTFPWYGEKCASTLTSTYSTGSNNKRMISRILFLHVQHVLYGTTPSLTWRDVQHIAVWTAEPEPLLKNNEGWVRNAAGLYVNSRFGFVIATIKDLWIFCALSISDTSGAVINFRTDACAGQTNEVNYLEHVQLILDIVYPIRGHLSIFVVSPQGTRTQLLKVRREDKSPAGFRHWPFMSVHTWAENPQGVWQLEVDDKSGRMEGINGIINNITLDLWLQRVKRLINDRTLQQSAALYDHILFLNSSPVNSSFSAVIAQSVKTFPSGWIFESALDSSEGKSSSPVCYLL